MVQHCWCHSPMITKQVINNYRNSNIDGVGLSISECCEVRIVNSFYYLLMESLFQVVTFIKQSNLFIVMSLFCLHHMWKLISRNYKGGILVVLCKDGWKGDNIVVL